MQHRTTVTIYRIVRADRLPSGACIERHFSDMQPASLIFVAIIRSSTEPIAHASVILFPAIAPSERRTQRASNRSPAKDRSTLTVLGDRQ